MSPAQSEDSGLAADRGTTYATISLPRENPQAMGIVFLGKFSFSNHRILRGVVFKFCHNVVIASIGNPYFVNN